MVQAPLPRPDTVPRGQGVQVSDAASLDVPSGQELQSPMLLLNCWPAGQLQTVERQELGSDGSGQENYSIRPRASRARE